MPPSAVKYDVLATADIHMTNNHSMGTVDRYGINSFLRMVHKLMLEMIDRSLAEDVPMIVAGDLFDSVINDPAVITVFHEIMAYAVNKGATLIILAGNHEFDGVTSVMNSYHTLERGVSSLKDHIFFVHDTRIFKYKDIELYCIPYLGKSIEQQYNLVSTFITRAFDSDCQKKLLILHYPITGCKYDDSSDVVASGFNLKAALDKNGNPFNYIIAGDFHDRQRLPGVDNFLYVGQPYQANFAAVDKKRGYTLINLSSGATKLVTSNNVLKFKIIHCTTGKVSDIQDDLENCVVRLILDDPTNRAALIDRAYERGAHKVQTVTRRKSGKDKIVKKDYVFTNAPEAMIEKYSKLICPDGVNIKSFTNIGVNLFKEVGSVQAAKNKGA